MNTGGSVVHCQQLTLVNSTQPLLFDCLICSLIPCYMNTGGSIVHCQQPSVPFQHYTAFTLWLFGPFIVYCEHCLVVS